MRTARGGAIDAQPLPSFVVLDKGRGVAARLHCFLICDTQHYFPAKGLREPPGKLPDAQLVPSSINQCVAMNNAGSHRATRQLIQLLV